MSPADSAGSADDRMTESTDAFERHRRLLFSVSYDMLGSVADAEDCLQEAWLRWVREDRSHVANPRSYLVRIVTNVTLNRLRVLRNRRETYVGPWLPEPMLTAPDVADEVADGTLKATTTLEITGNQVTDVHIVGNPDKLRHLELGRRDSRPDW